MGSIAGFRGSVDLLKLIVHEILCVQVYAHFYGEEVCKYSSDILRCLKEV